MKRALVIAGVAFAAAVGVGAGYWLASHRMMASAPAAAPADGRQPLYWHDPMYPQHKFDKPGKSPFMDMMLVPVYGDSGGDSGVAISPRTAQNLGVRTAEATLGPVDRRIEAVGAVAYDERAVSVVQARAAGYIERLHVRAPLDPVAAGQPLADIVAPEWAAAQEEYLALRRMPGIDAALRDAARQRLAVLGMPESTLEALDAGRKAQTRVTLVSPRAGVVGELAAREGMAVTPGQPLFRINGLATVWVNAEVPETDAALARPGAAVEATVAALPGETFRGKVAAVLPEVNPATRTLTARVELANPAMRLKPGMFATVSLVSGTRRQAVLVPTEAVIRTGERTVVIVAEAGPNGGQSFRPVPVETGAEFEGRTEIRSGLDAGAKVVASGQFLIDSEASLKGTASRMGPAAAVEHRGEGKVEKVGADVVTLSHGPIPSMQWGPMTMDFRLPPKGAAGVKEGDAVTFSFRPGKDGQFDITSMERKP